MNCSHCGTQLSSKFAEIMFNASVGVLGFLGGGGAGEGTCREGEGCRDEEPPFAVGGAR